MCGSQRWWPDLTSRWRRRRTAACSAGAGTSACFWLLRDGGSRHTAARAQSWRAGPRALGRAAPARRHTVPQRAARAPPVGTRVRRRCRARLLRRCHTPPRGGQAGQDHVVCAVAPVGHPHGSLMASLLSPAIDLRGQARGDAADDTFAATVAADAASSGVTLDAPAAAAAAPAAATAPAASAQQAKPVLSKYAAAAAVVSAELERVALPGARAPVLAAHSRAAAKVSHWLARGRGARDASDAATDATAAPAPAPLSPAEVEAARVALLAAAAHRPEFSDSLLLCEGKAMWAHCALLHLRCPELLRWCRAHHQPLLAAAAEGSRCSCPFAAWRGHPPLTSPRAPPQTLRRTPPCRPTRVEWW